MAKGEAMSIEAWTEAFVRAQSEFPQINKGQKATIPTKKGGEYEYTYAALPDVLEAVKSVLEKNGLAVAQSVAGDERSIAVETRIYHNAGHVESFGPLVLPSGGDARAAGSAITYARRYALCAALGLAPDEDDDGAQASRTREPKAQTPWEWVWNESAVFKAWTDKERLAAAQLALESHAFAAEPANMDEAKTILEHMRNQYETRTEALPLEGA